MRVCCFITSGDDFYCNMVLTSAAMLRQHNESVKVRIFLIDSDEPTKIDRYADRLGLEVVRRRSTEAARESKYFCLNRAHLVECEEDSVLYVDGDTFIFGDVEDIFDRHSGVDFAAATDDWITRQPDWDGGRLAESFRVIGSPPVPVFNGGLTLWNNGCVRGWSGSKLEEFCRRCQNKEFPMTPWLFGGERQCYHKETFSICFYVSETGLSYSVMDCRDVVNLFSEKELRLWGGGGFVVYHCFTQNWKKLSRQLVKRRKIAKYKMIGR